MRKSFLALALPVLFVCLGLRQAAQAESDKKAVEAAVLDYVEGVYEVDPARIARSVSKDLTKYGFWRSDAAAPYEGMAMNYDQLYHLAGQYNADGHIPADAPKEIVVLDLMDQTACARLTAEWGVDILQLARFDGRWQILHVLWQSHPEPGK